MPSLINSNFQTATNGQQFSFKGDVDFLQYFIRDGDTSILQSLITAYDDTKDYALRGLDKTVVGGNTTISEGHVFGISKAFGSMEARTYIYYAIAQTFPNPTGSDVIIGTVTPYSQAYADPTNFYDISTLTTTTQNVHNEYRIVWSTGASGSGDLDFDDLVVCKENRITLTPTGADWGAVGGGNFFYKRDLFTNLVNVSGSVVTTGTGAASVVAVLPTGYRPYTGLYYGSAVLVNGGTTTMVTITISGSTGEIGFPIASQVPTTSGVVLYINAIYQPY